MQGAGLLMAVGELRRLAVGHVGQHDLLATQAPVFMKAIEGNHARSRVNDLKEGPF